MRSTANGEDLDGLADGELLAHVEELVAEQNRLAARLAAAVRRRRTGRQPSTTG